MTPCNRHTGKVTYLFSIGAAHSLCLTGELMLASSRLLCFFSTLSFIANGRGLCLKNRGGTSALTMIEALMSLSVTNSVLNTSEYLLNSNELHLGSFRYLISVQFSLICFNQSLPYNVAPCPLTTISGKTADRP